LPIDPNRDCDLTRAGQFSHPDHRQDRGAFDHDHIDAGHRRDRQFQRLRDHHITIDLCLAHAGRARGLGEAQARDQVEEELKAEKLQFFGGRKTQTRRRIPHS